MYGIPNCDTVKKTRVWLDQHGQAYDFVDFKKTVLTREMLAIWMAELGWQALLNRQGTTWRKLGPERQAQVVDAATAATLMLAQPSVIKRPVLHWGSRVTAGYQPAQWQF